MSVVSAPRVTEVSPELQGIVNGALHRMVQHVFEEAFKLEATPCNKEIAEALRATVGEEAVRIWEDFVDDLGF